MDDAKFFEILDSGNYLLEELASFGFLESLLLDYVIKQLTLGNVLSDQIQLLWSLDDLVQLNYIWVPGQLQYFDLSRHALDIDILDDFMLLQYLNSYFFSGDVVDS